MRLKEDLCLRKTAERNVVIPMGERLLEFGGMMELNETGAFLWRMLEKESTYKELLEALLEEYEVDKPIAEKALNEFLEQLHEKRVLEGD